MTPAPDFEAMLRAAVRQAREQAPRALDDLQRCSSQAAAAVASVTDGRAVLELVPINQAETASPVYQLLLRRVRGEAPPADLGVYCLSSVGYPILRWHGRHAWQAQPERPRDTFMTVAELERHFQWLVSEPESRLVILVTFFQEQAVETTGS